MDRLKSLRSSEGKGWGLVDPSKREKIGERGTGRRKEKRPGLISHTPLRGSHRGRGFFRTSGARPVRWGGERKYLDTTQRSREGEEKEGIGEGNRKETGDFCSSNTRLVPTNFQWTRKRVEKENRGQNLGGHTRKGSKGVKGTKKMQKKRKTLRSEKSFRHEPFAGGTKKVCNPLATGEGGGKEGDSRRCY